jgi:outer membrane usher protein
MRCIRPTSGLFLACLLAATAVLATVAASANESSADAALLLADVQINGLGQGVTLLARDETGQFHADADALKRWRLPVPAVASLELYGLQYYALGALDGLVVTLDQRAMRVEISVPPALLGETSHSLAQPFESASQFESLGAYLDYDLAYTQDSSPSRRTLSGLLRPTLFTRRGSLSSEFLYNNQGDVYDVADKGWKRLETVWTYDDPGRMRSLRFGDSVTLGSGWARSVRFGGFQIASNFSTRPNEIMFPQPSIAGTAAVPSVLDIYVNGQMRSQLEVPGGAFEINDIPVVTGAGQIQVVARDLLGREQIITQDFYSTERLLRPGLNEYSLSVGRLRESFALRSNDYGETLLSGSLRHGVNDRLTVSGQMAVTGSKKVAGTTLAMTFGGVGVTSASLARSSADRSGSLWLLAHQYQGHRFRVDVRLQGASAQFFQPGVDLARAYPKRQTTISGGVGLRQHGSIGMSLVNERMHDGIGRRIANVSYSRSLPAGFILSVAASRIETDISFTEASVNLTRSLGPRASTSMSFSQRADGRRSRVDHRYDLPSGPGFGYRTSIQTGTQDSSDAEILLNTAFARYAAEYRSNGGAGALRVQSRGSLARFGGGWFPAREISDGFAVVDAGGMSGVQVYLENRAIGVTRADGLLLVPRLRPYEQNRLRIETADIPITVRVDEPLLTVSPYYRSGTLASFGVRVTTSVILRAIQADGHPVPEGARARIAGGPFKYPVGLDGRLYLEGLAPGERVEVLAAGEICTLDLQGVAVDAEFSELGDIRCARDDGQVR